MIARKIIIYFLLVFVLIYGGCTLKGTSLLPVNKLDYIEWPDSQIEDVFGEYWGYRSSGDAINVLKLEAPYVKVMVDIERYTEFIKAGKKKNWNAVRIDKIELIDQNLIRIGFTAEIKEDASIRVREVYFRDRWVLMNGRWYHAFDDPIINPDN